MSFFAAVFVPLPFSRRVRVGVRVQSFRSRPPSNAFGRAIQLLRAGGRVPVIERPPFRLT